MRLSKIHVTNFRSVEDSTEFDVGQVLALVGKNEAGKTAILQALAGLNPHPLTPVSYDIERDYPRRFLTEYAQRHPKENAKVVSTKWTLTEEEKKAIQDEIGDALQDSPVVIYCGYKDTQPTWELPIDYAKAAQISLRQKSWMTRRRLHSRMRKALQSCGRGLKRSKSQHPDKNTYWNA
ncbi:MAG: hypothetical protein DMG49_22695 [Acidobacteria bacterium]|nr:MAG: hypothetical protein DMG49_22695 [Acidobacteriota bacterium]